MQMEIHICSHCGKLIEVANQTSEGIYDEFAGKVLVFFDNITLCDDCFYELANILNDKRKN